jgi:predicted XRE-type DNA-binding protein
MKTQTTTDVFRDLAFDPEEAENLRIRAALMTELSEHIRRSGMTQSQAATALGVTQPRISDLVRGKIDVFSIDTLIALISKAGIRISMRVGGTKVA